MKDFNSRTVNVKITRHELSDLIKACTIIRFEYFNGNIENAYKWKNLQEKLENILKDFDEKSFEK